MTKKMKYCLAIVLLLQVFLIVYFGMQKSGFHVDEIYTYTLSNYEDGFVCDTEGVVEGWKSGEFYSAVLEVSREEAFSYNIPYVNQTGDVHPPLYYFIIHTVSSLVSGSFSKWIGISVNIFFNVLTTLVLFWVSKRIFKNDVLAIFSTAVWALSNGVIESGVFIRMYAMLTLFSVTLVGLHLKGFEELKVRGKLSMSTLGMMSVCTMCGVLTQYYYMVFCFFLCGFFALYLFYIKSWKNLMHYIASEIGALLISVACFPYMLKHIFGGYRGEQAFQSVLEMQGYGGVLKSVASIISNDLFNGLGEEIAVILLIIYAMRAFCRKNKNTDIFNKHLVPIILAIISICYTLVIAKIAPYQANRYYMCIYPLLVIVFVFELYHIFKLKRKGYRLLVVGIFSAAITGSGCLLQDVDYLYQDCAMRVEQLKPYEGMPAIILNGIYEYGPDNWIHEYGNYEAVYRCEEYGELQGLSNAVTTHDVSNGFLMYAYGMSQTDEELLENIKEYIDIECFEKITDIRCRVFFCTLKSE